MITIRSAEPSDAALLVPLFTESSGGVMPALWGALADPGEPLERAAVCQLSDPQNALSIFNTVLAVSDDSVLGAMCCFQEVEAGGCAKEVKPLPLALDAAMQPYRELVVADSLFVAELCSTPQARGQGVGTLLLKHAVGLAQTRNLSGVSLRVFSANTGAIRLYKRFGFRVVGERDLVPHPAISVAGAVLLMAYQL